MQISISIPADIQVSSAAKKVFLESAPYVMRGNFPIQVIGDQIIVSGVPSEHPHDLEVLLIESLKKSVGTVDREQDVTLKENAGAYELQPDVFDELVRTRQVFPTAEGKVAYSGDAALVFRGIDNLIRSWADEFSADEEFYPPSVKYDTLKSIGYFDTFAQHAFFISPAAFDTDALELFKTESGSSQALIGGMQAPDWVLAPTVCHHAFEARAGQNIQTPRLISALNPCSRFEVNDVNGLQRLRHYWMREVILLHHEKSEIGPFLDKFLDKTTEALDRWDLTYRVGSASDPFFLDSGTSKRFFQTSFQLKRELLLPKPTGEMACASFNNHVSTLCDSFKISNGSDDDGVFSGCIGWGYDRLIYALYLQLGANVSDWPTVIRNDLGLMG